MVAGCSMAILLLGSSRPWGLLEPLRSVGQLARYPSKVAESDLLAQSTHWLIG